MIEEILDERKHFSKGARIPLAIETKREVTEDTGKLQKTEPCPGHAAPLS